MRKAVAVRETVRLVLLNEKNEILLMKIEDKSVYDTKSSGIKPRWVTIGGKIESGENHQQAAARELKEETGIENVTIGKRVWYGEHYLNWKGINTLLKESFYYVRASNSKISSQGMLEDERAVFKEHKWWSVEEILSSDEIIIPKGLGALLKPLIKGEIPDEPLTIDLSTPIEKPQKKDDADEKSIFSCRMF